MRILIRRDTSTAWQLNGDTVLLDGEMGYETDTKKLKIGNSATPYGDPNFEYFAGGITGTVFNGGILKDPDGKLYFDSSLVLGDIEEGATVKSYVDGLVQGEGSTRAQEDQLLSDRVDEVTANVTTVTEDLATESSNRQSADSSLQQQVTGVINNLATESSNRQAADSSLQQQVVDVVSDVAGKADLAGANFTGVITAPSGENVIPFLFTDQDAFPAATDVHGAILHSHADAAMFFAHAGAYHQVLDANTAYDKTEVDGKFGTLSISGPTGGEFASDNVTDFVSELLFLNAAGDMGGLSMKAYVDAADAALGVEIRALYNPIDSTGMVVDLGAQINALTDRVTAVEGKVGVLENKFDADGDFTGNTTGNHTGDVQNGAGDIVVDAANKLFLGDLTGNVTGDTVGTHVGSVKNDVGDVTLVDATTAAFVGVTMSLSGAAGVAGTLQVDDTVAAKSNMIVGDVVTDGPPETDGNGFFYGSVHVGHNLLARSASLNDNIAGPDGAVVPFLATEPEHAITKAYLEANTYTQAEVAAAIDAAIAALLAGLPESNPGEGSIYVENGVIKNGS